jgi:hypothetical protein
VIYGVGKGSSSPSPADPDQEVTFQLTTALWTDSWADAYKKSIAATIDGSSTYTGRTITGNDVTIQKISTTENPALLSPMLKSRPVVATSRRRLLQALPVLAPATLNVTVLTPSIDDQVGAPRSPWHTYEITNLIRWGMHTSMHFGDGI